jgi:hypothetical protein
VVAPGLMRVSPPAKKKARARKSGKKRIIGSGSGRRKRV